MDIGGTHITLTNLAGSSYRTRMPPPGIVAFGTNRFDESKYRSLGPVTHCQGALLWKALIPTPGYG
jgi:hypothetical protein